MATPDVFAALWLEFVERYGTFRGWRRCAFCFRELDPAVTEQLHDRECIIGRVQSELLKAGLLAGQLGLRIPPRPR